jgi:peptidoglycan-associated lipoprotein
MKKILVLLSVLILFSACASKPTNTDNFDDLGETNESVKVDEKGKTDFKTTKTYFKTNAYNIESEYKDNLLSQVDFFKKEKASKVTIKGYCDERGTKEYNIILGQKRANAIKDFLIENGISTDKIETISYGKDKQIVNGHGEKIWKQNRVAIIDINE